MVKKFYQVFLRGFFLVLPLTLSLYIMYWLGHKAESLFSSFIKVTLGTSFYFPGMGLILGIAIIFFLGLVGGHYIAAKFIKFFEGLLIQVPLLKAVYGPLRDLMNLFRTDNEMARSRVVLVRMEGENVEVLGLVTRDRVSSVKIPGREDRVAVYIPLSYMFGGVTLLVPRDKITEVNMSVEEALKLAITGWIKTS